VVGVITFFICVDPAGEGSVTAVIIAEWQRNVRAIVKRKDDIGRPQKAKRLTVKPKIAVGMA
jgi:hypothetical protein